jgi:hypothetical protein
MHTFVISVTEANNSLQFICIYNQKKKKNEIYISIFDVDGY